MLLFLLRSSAWLLALSVGFGLLAGLTGGGLIAVINMALDSEREAAAQLGLVFVGLCLVLVVTRMTAALILIRLGQNVIFDLRLKLSQQILRTSFLKLQALGPARILVCLTQDVSALAEAFRWLPMLCVNTAIVIGCLLYMGWLSVGLLILVLSALALGVTSFRLIENRGMRGLRKVRETDDRLYTHFRSLTEGMKELKLHEQRRAAFLSECLETTAKSYRRHYLKGTSFYILAGNWGNNLFYLVIGIILFLPPNFQDDSIARAANNLGLDISEFPIRLPITPEVTRGYCLTILYMMAPLAALMDRLPVLTASKISLEKIKALIWDSRESEPEKSAASASFSEPAVLTLTGVTHRYQREGGDHPFTLGPLNLTLRPGELVFLTGGNGSGKTTLALLLVGLYAPEQGNIRLGKTPISNANREDYRQHFSAVFSDFYLFDSLLGFNGQELDAEARAYLARLNLEHKVRIENGAFSTLDLSQGQRKRLALLVAYLENRPFYLFDEWAADQDPVFKKIFYTEILMSLKAKGKTVVVISHDDAYFDVADRHLKLEDGKLIEMSVDSKRRTVSGKLSASHKQATDAPMNI